MCTPAHRGNAPSPRHPTSLPPHLSLPTQMECSTSPNLYSTLSLPSLYPFPMHTSEMVHFESRPNFHVTAGLWTPAPDAPGKDAQGRRAGILYASGHSCQAWRRYDGAEFWNYQFLLLNLVRTCTTLHAARCTLHAARVYIIVYIILILILVLFLCRSDTECWYLTP